MESYDDKLYVVSLFAHHANYICEGRDKYFMLPYSVPKQWLKRHSYVAIHSRPHQWTKDKSVLLPTFEGIIGMAEIIGIESPAYVRGNGYTYQVGHAHYLSLPFPLKQKRQLVCLPLEIRDEFLSYTGYQVW